LARHRLMLTWWRAQGLTTHVMIAAWDLGPYLSPQAATHGLRALTSSWARHHVNISLCRAKTSGHYVNSMLALNTAVKARNPWVAARGERYGPKSQAAIITWVVSPWARSPRPSEPRNTVGFR